jgi:hypothetical protein
LSNFTVQDINGSLLAFLLFPLVIVIPGWVVSWIFGLFDFRKRTYYAKLPIAILLSIAIVPALVFLVWRLTSFSVVLGILIAFLIVFCWTIYRDQRSICALQATWTRHQRIIALLAAGWVLFAILAMVDLQWNGRLYYTVVSYDWTTRAAIINAIARTGVPPVNPSFYPGYPVPLTLDYYYWYILCGIIEKIADKWVDARMALIASVAWCGLGVMSAIGLYLRLRQPSSRQTFWRKALTGIALLSVSGLDFIPALFYMIASGVKTGNVFLGGNIEIWNEQISAWFGSFFWVPHHVVAMLACLTGMLLYLWARDRNARVHLMAALVTGLGFASALGLSTWVTLIFAVFWGVWMLKEWLTSKDWKWALWMLLPGLISVLVAAPFLRDLVATNGAGGGTSGGFPIVFEVRRFAPFIYTFNYMFKLPTLARWLVDFLLLPVNYLFELGFFFLIGLFWLQSHGRGVKKSAFQSAEILLLGVVLLITTFFRSNVILNNDLGWRGWLLGQFILVIWATDLLESLWGTSAHTLHALAGREITRVKNLLSVFLILGVITSVVDVALLRTWPMLLDERISSFPNEYSLDDHLGQRTYSARAMYAFLRDNLPSNAIVESNPAISLFLNLPSGLYRTRQVAISDHTLYGIGASVYQPLIDRVSLIFSQTSTDWPTLDHACRNYSIDYLILSDTDPVWLAQATLARERPPFYENQFFAVFACGAPNSK